MKFISTIILFCSFIMISACAKTQDSIADPNNSSIMSTTNTKVQTLSDAEEIIENHDEFDESNEFDESDEFDEFDEFDDYDFEARTDPFILWNKIWYKFNDVTLLYVIKPTYKGYKKAVPQTFRNGIGNFKHNFTAPVRMGNALLQAEFAQFFIEFGNLMVNMMTSGGFADVASQHEPLFPHTPEDLRLGYTLAKWNIPQGSYFVLPFYGPSTIREGFGTIGDTVMNPVSYFFPWEVSYPLDALLAVNDLEGIIAIYETLKENSIDPYISLRNMYLERLNYTDPKK